MREELWKAFKEASDRSILFIIRNNPARRTQQKFLIFTFFLLYILVSIFLIVCVIKHEEGLVIAVVNTVFFLMVLVIFCMIRELVDKKENIIEVISWLTEPTWKKFPNSLQPEAGNRFNRISHISTRIILLQIRLYDILSATATFGIGTLMQFIPSLRYQLPLPWHLPIDNYKRLIPFVGTLILQTIVTISMSQVIAFFASFLIVFYLHVREFLEIILKGLNQLNHRLRNVENVEMVDFDDSLKVLVKMIVSCLRIMSTFTKTMSNILMCLEIISMFSIFTNAFIVLIVQQKEHYFIGVSILIFNLITLIIAYVNDKLKEKISDVSYALYQLPWDELTPKQRNFIQFSMKCINVDVTLNCANMHEFNLERFGRITKQTYSNALVLKRILEKSLNASFE